MSAKKISKVVKSTKQEKPTFISTFNLSNYIPEKYHILVFALIILALFLFFFSPLYFGGKTFQSGDIITRISLDTYLDKEKEDLLVSGSPRCERYRWNAERLLKRRSDGCTQEARLRDKKRPAFL